MPAQGSIAVTDDTNPNFPLDTSNNDYMKSISQSHYYDAVNTATLSVGKITDGVPLKTKEEAEELFKRIKKAYTGVRSLEKSLGHVL